VARSLELSTDEDQARAVTLEAWDVDGDALTLEILALPLHGMLVGEGATWVYEPHPDFHGTDEFLYRVSDRVLDSQPATVRIVVAPVNDAPSVRGGEYRVVEGVPREFLLEAGDADADGLSFRITEGPAHGTISGSLPSVRYSAEAGYTGSDRIEFVASDGLIESPVGLIQLEVMRKAAFEVALSVKVEDGQLRLNWGAVGGEGYRLWRRADLFNGDWVLVAELPPSDPSQATVSVTVSAIEGYYRCEVLAY
jgi:hypothetical protein